MNQIANEQTFIRRPLRTPGLERVIRGVAHRRERVIEVTLLIEGVQRGGLQIRAESAPVIAQALADVRTSTADRKIGSFRDSRFDVNVSIGPHPARCTAIYLQKIDDAGIAAGRPVALYGEELDALEAAVAWLLAA